MFMNKKQKFPALFIHVYGTECQKKRNQQTKEESAEYGEKKTILKQKRNTWNDKR